MTGNVYVTFNVREDYLPEITVGKELAAYIPAFDKEITVRITRIKDVGSFAVWKATKASGGYDLKMFEVRGVPVNAEDTEHMRSGMSVILK